jgi:hypothetical protein
MACKDLCNGCLFYNAVKCYRMITAFRKNVIKMETLEVRYTPDMEGKGASPKSICSYTAQHYVKLTKTQYFSHFRITSIFFLPQKYVLSAH